MKVIEKNKRPEKPSKKIDLLKKKLMGRMTDPNNEQDPNKKKGFSRNFFFILIAAFFLILTMQSLSSSKGSKVSFSHQVEHLVNLDFLKKGHSEKTAQNDNLVTFRGRFKDSITQESKNRYRFLELLNTRNTLIASKSNLSEQLETQQERVFHSAGQFLSIVGEQLPKEGFVVVSRYYNTQARENAVILKSLPQYSGASLAKVGQDLNSLSSKATLTQDEVNSLGSDIHGVLQSLRSPSVGIGSGSAKLELSKLSKKLTALNANIAMKSRELKLIALDSNTSMKPRELMSSYSEIVASLSSLVKGLMKETGGVKLAGLRSVRNYLVDVEQYSKVVVAQSDNQLQVAKTSKAVESVTWFFNDQEMSTKTLMTQSPENYALWFTSASKEWGDFAENQGLPFKAPDQSRNNVLDKTFTSRENSPNYFSYLFFTILPVFFVIMLLYFVFSKQMKGGSGGAMNFGKSPAKMLNQSSNKVLFGDVAGVVEAKEELEEVVEFLRDPTKFTALGAKIPKGVLLIGPPGTGKTLIAKAVAGEANRPFFSISGSNFVEMFVGVGASRIRDLFAQAKKQAPCIIFIDEIDAVGRHRGSGVGGGNDEREQTLNQLLVEMDGFETNEGVILMAATNRPDVLDKALLRPGRFDRQVTLDLPDIKGRFEILKVHARKIKLDSSVDLKEIARATPGSSGADLMNILNESALLAARKGRNAVIRVDALEACEKVRYGKERRSLELDEKEKLHTAYHESGHAIVGLSVKYSDPVEKVTIIPRGMSLGATHFIPEKNKLSYWRLELIDRLAVLMGGRVAEDKFIHDISSGAQMDISQATSLARSMVCKWGMTEKLGPVAYDDGNDQNYMPMPSSKSYSEQTANMIDAEVKKLLEEANNQAKEIIEANKDKMELMTQMLMEFEVLDKEDVGKIMDGSWDSESKRNKMKDHLEACTKMPPPPPPAQQEDNQGQSSIDDPAPGQA
ncbi:cell division protein FtsH [Candidatus Aerophobetes bacterium]|uniref:ATP-dependent zinc metalloprotease FtsH n=1 Tax=Aerophobetes bacterium TaxID=2030807 RepID=A0A2A4WZR6_UNCAE|nr:MAG: cell division protein FtsH [Candidatus Aerophobetes bacterium]